jgi:hypothetical protein
MPWPYKHRVRARDLRRLSKSARSSGEEAVEKYYEWREARAMTVAKGAGGAALSLLTAWLVPFLKNEFKDTPAVLAVALPVGVVVGLSCWALVALRRLDSIHRSFIVAVAWLARLKA